MEKEHKIIIGLIVVILLMLAAFVGIFANTQLINKTAPPVNNTTHHTNITKNTTTACVEEQVTSDESNNVESSNDKQKVKDTRMAGYDSPKYNNYESTRFNIDSAVFCYSGTFYIYYCPAREKSTGD